VFLVPSWLVLTQALPSKTSRYVSAGGKLPGGKCPCHRGQRETAGAGIGGMDRAHKIQRPLLSCCWCHPRGSQGTAVPSAPAPVLTLLLLPPPRA